MERTTSKTWVYIVVALLAVAALGATAYALMNDSEQSDTKTLASQETKKETAETPQTTEVGPADAVQPTIVFTDEGFSQESYTFPSGTAIRVENKSSMDMQFSSDDHPSHRDHAELNMELLGPGESGTFTPPGAGTYGFHDHINDQYEGTLVIQ